MRRLQFLDVSPVVERYAWFTDRWGADVTISLLSLNASELTPTGQVLISRCLCRLPNHVLGSTAGFDTRAA